MQANVAEIPFKLKGPIEKIFCRLLASPRLGTKGTDLLKISGTSEGTGTRPDSLANRADQKNEGPHGKKSVRKSRNSLCVSGGGMGAQGQLTRGANGAVLEPNTNAQRLSFISHLLCSPWHPLAPNFGSLSRSFWCQGVPR